jgi:tetratricopeptide (TPR) repeat protein
MDSDTERAKRLTAEGAEIFARKPERALDAIAVLQKALDADPFYGPAFNNIGVIELSRGRLYEAAYAFEQARKHMPGNPEARFNLGMTFEAAGRSEEAMRAYAGALEVSPSHMASKQAMVRLQIRTGATNERTRGYLEEIAMKGDSEQWREWARGQQRMVRSGTDDQTK